ncbi:uncharacterized protein LOC117233332 [Bombus vosnesenskii]|uniref:Uncharacterized protein LOC117233332 n=1 Tax=Bombus vosnesenskii TaxID=207650 RepID=A0A6J3KA89_9HYME|nr:uncharacterized protein LOC117233332 [Bombus vosnesenskii]
MAASLLKMYSSSIRKCLRHVSKYCRIGSRRATFHCTAKNLKVKCNDKPFFTTRLALPPDYENVADFMCEAYYKHEPVVINIGLGGTEAPPIWRRMMLEQVKAGYSIIAENRENCIIGAALNCITDHNEQKMLCKLARCCEDGPLRDLIEFFAFVLEAPKIWERFPVRLIFEQCSLAVSCEYQGLGIAKRLIQESWHLARDCGYRLFRLDCNSSYCAKIAQGFGWPMIWDIPFDQYVKNGKVIFNHVKEPHTTCRVFVDHLRYCKTYCLPYKDCKTITSAPFPEK